MSVFSVRLPDDVQVVLATLRQNGFCGYLVGGSLRDLLLGLPSHDFDLTTDASPEDMLRVFRDFRTIPTGLKHGTVTVLSGGYPIEITTHRVDGTYADSRHPESVRFTSNLQEDLSRRDFTVNAMAWSEETGLVDLFGGREDLTAGVLRAVGDPEKRFTEDALRILRLFRFSAQLDFEMEENTFRGAVAAQEGLSHISAERIFGELSRMLSGKAAAKGLSAMEQSGCFRFVFGELTPDMRIVPALSALPAEPAVRLAALLRDAGPENARALCKRLHTSNDFAATVSGVISAANDPLPGNAYEARRYVCGHYHYWRTALSVLCAAGVDTDTARALCESVVRDHTAIDLPRLAVNGRMLQEKAGVRPEKTAAVLRYLQDMVWQDPAKNKRPLLIEAATDLEKENHENG